MKKLQSSSALVFSIFGMLLLTTTSYAQNSPSYNESLTQEQRDAVKERVQNATPEQKDAFKQKAREKWQNTSPEQKEVRRAKVRERVKNMSPEQKARLKERIKSRRAAHGANIR